MARRDSRRTQPPSARPQTYARRREGARNERRLSMTDANKKISRSIIEEMFNKGRLEIADELLAPNAVLHDPALPEPIRGAEGFKENVAHYRAAFPDIHMVVDDQCADDSNVCTRWTATGTHEGELMGINPTGRQATVTGMTMDRIEDGRIVESWTNWDTLGLLQQIGAIPAPAQARS